MRDLSANYKYLNVLKIKMSFRLNFSNKLFKALISKCTELLVIIKLAELS